jgi:hypothetical protein
VTREEIQTSYRELKANNMVDQEKKKLPAFLKTVYLSNREIRLILAGLYSLQMPDEEIEGTLWKKLLFEKLHKKTRRKKN